MFLKSKPVKQVLDGIPANRKILLKFRLAKLLNSVLVKNLLQSWKKIPDCSLQIVSKDLVNIDPGLFLFPEMVSA